MAKDFIIMAGSVSQGIWRSPDGGTSWRNFHGKKMPIWAPFNLESQVRGLAVDPNNASVIYAGDEMGVCKSIDKGDNWERLHGPIDGLTFWSLAVDPTDSNIVFAGSRPAGLFRSKDAGKTWEKLKADLPQTCHIGIPRVTALRIDPRDHRNIWAGIEIGGVYRSMDGGDSWSYVRSGFPEMDDHQDIHDITLVPNADLKVDPSGSVSIIDGKRTVVMVNAQYEMEVTADGEKWYKMIQSKQDLFLPYMRAINFKPTDPKTIYLGLGDGAIGSTGGIARSKDGGLSWQRLKLPGECNSGIFGLQLHPSNPERIVACTMFGQFFISEDGGDTWTKPKREVNELRALTWVPA